MSTTDDRSAATDRVQFAPGLWRTDLQRQDLSIPGREVVQSRVDIDPEAPAVKHTHPGEEIIYVLDGSLEYQVEGQPTRTFHAGDALTVPAGAVHAVRNVGSGTGSVLATDVVRCRRERQAAPHAGRVSASPPVRPSFIRPAQQQGEEARRTG